MLKDWRMCYKQLERRQQSKSLSTRRRFLLLDPPMDMLLMRIKYENLILILILTLTFFLVLTLVKYVFLRTRKLWWQVHPEKFFCAEYEKSKALADKIAIQAASEGVPIVPVYPGVIYGPGKITAGNVVALMVWLSFLLVSFLFSSTWCWN